MKTKKMKTKSVTKPISTEFKNLIINLSLTELLQIKKECANKKTSLINDENLLKKLEKLQKQILNKINSPLNTVTFKLFDNIYIKGYFGYDVDLDKKLFGYIYLDHSRLTLHNNGKNIESDIDKKLAIKFIKSHLDSVELCSEAENLFEKHQEFIILKQEFINMCEEFNNVCKENKLIPEEVWDLLILP